MLSYIRSSATSWWFSWRLLITIIRKNYVNYWWFIFFYDYWVWNSNDIKTNICWLDKELNIIKVLWKRACVSVKRGEGGGGGMAHFWKWWEIERKKEGILKQRDKTPWKTMNLFFNIYVSHYCISYGSQPFNLLCKSSDWFLYEMQQWDRLG